MKGLIQLFIREHGPEALIPRRKAPLTFSIFQALIALQSVTVGSMRWSSDSVLGVSTIAMMCLLWSSGFRKAEIVDNAKGSYLTRASLRWFINGTYVSTPNALHFQQMREGVSYVEVWPKQSKCDATGEIWGGQKTFHTYHKRPGNCCAALAALEQRFPVEASERDQTALFIGNDGQPVRADFAARLLAAMLVAIGVSSFIYTWHSFRISLATRLGRANCPDSKIQAICRWQTTQSLLIYRRMGKEDYDEWLGCAFDAEFNAGSNPTVQVDSVEALAELSAATAEDLHGGDQPEAPIDERLNATKKVPLNQTLTRPTRSKRKAWIPIPLSDTTPLIPRTAAGRRVLVPILPGWESYPCEEHGGKGWEAVVVSATGVSALVNFIYASTARGRPYAKQRVPLDKLTPL
jgi:hypothetical protein